MQSLYKEKQNISCQEIHIQENAVSKAKRLKDGQTFKIDFQLRLANSSQDILRLVPGLFIAQLAGGGKAGQIFFRGFDVENWWK